MVVALAGFRGQKFSKTPLEGFPDMDRQEKVKAQKPGEFFTDGRGARPPILGTQPVGYAIPSTARQLLEDEILEPAPWSQESYQFTAGDGYVGTGQMDGNWGDGIPMEITTELLALGRDKFTINCQICHGQSGNGNGIVTQYDAAYGNLIKTSTYHQDRLRDMPDGQLFNTITYGVRQMYGYGSVLTVRERWAIVAYLRVLQASQNVSGDRLTAEVRARVLAAEAARPAEPESKAEGEPEAEGEAAPSDAQPGDTDETGADAGGDKENDATSGEGEQAQPNLAESVGAG